MPGARRGGLRSACECCEPSRCAEARATVRRGCARQRTDGARAAERGAGGSMRRCACCPIWRKRITTEAARCATVAARPMPSRTTIGRSRSKPISPRRTTAASRWKRCGVRPMRWRARSRPGAQARFAEALDSRGNVLLELRRHAEAAQCFVRLVAVAPDHPYAMAVFITRCCIAATGPNTRRWRRASAVLAGRRAAMPFSFFSRSAHRRRRT